MRLCISSTDYEYECRCMRVQFRLDRNWATNMRRANANARRASRDCALQRFSIIHVHSFPLSLNARSPATGGTPCRALTPFPCDRDRRPWLTSRVQYPPSLSSRYPSFLPHHPDNSRFLQLTEIQTERPASRPVRSHSSGL